MDYHKGILTESQLDISKAIRKICTAIPKMVTEDQNRALMRAASLEEVEEVVMSMKKGTTPGPDSFTVDFYQAGWNFMGKEILELIEESRMNQKVWPALNSTFFTLIPKNDKSKDAKGFRPIALCNVIYKIISSLMAKRLKPLLENPISPEQTGFVEGRKILDGLVVTQEVIYSMKTKKQKGMMIKLDLSKAYDRINWQYLEEILRSFGFNNRWIRWVLSCISTPNFSILVNGTPLKTFKASRGIRQGDLISPFLFILVVEGLGRYLKQERITDNIKGLRLWGNELPITHQQFVDDIMLFGEPTVREVRNLKKALDLFAEASGMEINKEKSCTFIFNTLETVKRHMIRMLGFKQGELPTKYLGNVLDYNSKILKNWHGFLQKLKNRVANWTFRILNIARRIVLVKSVLKEIPIYPLSIMAVPQGVCTKIREILRKFIWGGSSQQKKWALVSWKHLKKRKEEGGLGLRDPGKLNKILGAKLWWRWMRGGNDLWKKLWRHKYNMPDSTEAIYRMQETPRGSKIWELASQNRDIVGKNVFWEIRGGGEAKFWDENSHQREKMSNIQRIHNMQNKIGDNHVYVKDYWKENELDGIWRKWTPMEEWGIETDQEQHEAFMKEVESSKVKARTRKHIIRWGKSTKGSFTVKEAYYLVDQEEITERNQDWKGIWGKNWWLKITIFAWLVAKHKILTWDKLQKKGFSGPSRCYLCKRETKTQEHLLINCGYARNLWREVGRLFCKLEKYLKETNEVIFLWQKEKFQCRVVRRAWDLIAGFVLWMVWKERNRRIFQNKVKNSEKIWKRVVNLTRETILVKKWDMEDWKTDQGEEQILQNLNLKYEMVHNKQSERINARHQSHDKFVYPKDNFIKLNFDGASKGNPGNAGFGGIFHDNQGNTRWIYAEWGGEMTNNEAELWVVQQGLRIVIHNGYKNLEIEGDSQMAIEILKKPNNKNNWEQVTNSWRTAGIIQEIAELMKGVEYNIFKHVKRNGNRAADFLANWGCKGRDGKVDNQWRTAQAFNDCQKWLREDIIDHHAGIKPECAKTKRKNQPYNNPIKAKNPRRGRKDMSESINGNQTNKTVDRKGEGRINRWQRKDKQIGRRSGAGRSIKARQQGTRQRKKVIETYRGIGGAETASKSREKLNRFPVKYTMETRKRARIAEEMEAERGRERDRKGKEVMKEEKVEEIYEIFDDSKEDADRKTTYGRNRSEDEWEQQQISDDQWSR
eukprot:PITA_33746